jgi:hypothetical protein
VEINPRFLAQRDGSNWDIIEQNIRNLENRNPSLDLVHARYVGIHIPDYEAALERMIAHLKP